MRNQPEVGSVWQHRRFARIQRKVVDNSWGPFLLRISDGREAYLIDRKLFEQVYRPLEQASRP